MYKDTTLPADFMYHLVEALKAHSETLTLLSEMCDLVCRMPSSDIDFYCKHLKHVKSSLEHTSNEITDVAMAVFNEMEADHE